MAAVQVSAPSAPLSAEPSLPDERTQQYLAPKSYVDAVEMEPATNGAYGTDGIEGAGGTRNAVSANESSHGGGQKLKPAEQTASVSSTEKTDLPDSEGKVEVKPPLERQVSKNEYSATGLDDAPRSPSRYKHRKSPSLKSNGFQEKPKIEERDPNANGLNDPKTQAAKDDSDKTLVFERIEGERNGSRLISVKSAGILEKEIQLSEKELPKHDRDEGLVSGRKAGQRWETSGIRFAPMNVPLRRRLQTLVVLFHTLCIAISVSAFFFLCAIPLFWPLLIPYMIYCMASKASTSGTLSHRSDFLRSLPVWSLFASYFPARLHRTQELPPTRKYIFGYHPHGIIAHGSFAAFATEALGFSQLFPGIRNTLLTLDSNFRIPIYRDYALAMGLASVSKESCENLLSKGGPNKEGMGRAITIVIGGASESLDAQPYSIRLVLKRRKGFVKMAIRTGADLVPVLAFGENDLYDQFLPDSHPMIHKFQLLVKKVLGFTIPLFHARGVFNYDVGLLPYRQPLNIVVGRPIRVAQYLKPDQEYIDRVHEEYITELVRVWDLWKDDFAPRRKGELQILE